MRILRRGPSLQDQIKSIFKGKSPVRSERKKEARTGGLKGISLSYRLAPDPHQERRQRWKKQP